MRVSAFVLLALIAVGVVAYPLQKQCDSHWGGENLAHGPKTICQIGCAMTCVSMALAGTGKTINGAGATPQTLNNYLNAHGGYSGQLINWGATSALGLHYVGKVSAGNCAANFNAGKVVILNVRNRGHWVLMTGHNGSTFTVNDPGFSVSSYPQSDVAEAAVYSH